MDHLPPIPAAASSFLPPLPPSLPPAPPASPTANQGQSKKSSSAGSVVSDFNQQLRTALEGMSNTKAQEKPSIHLPPLNLPSSKSHGSKSSENPFAGEKITKAPSNNTNNFSRRERNQVATLTPEGQLKIGRAPETPRPEDLLNKIFGYDLRLGGDINQKKQKPQLRPMGNTDFSSGKIKKSKSSDNDSIDSDDTNRPSSAATISSSGTTTKDNTATRSINTSGSVSPVPPVPPLPSARAPLPPIKKNT